MKAFALAAALLFPAPASAAAPSALPVHAVGRVVQENGALRFGWPGIYFESRFRGTGVRVAAQSQTEIFRLLVDGEEKARLVRPDGKPVLVDGLAPGEHVVRLEKLTESQSGGGRFLGFFPVKGDVPLSPPKRARQIEFIGDSFTVGYGNTSPKTSCTPQEVHDTTDTQQAFGPLTAKHFDADYRINAYSGHGIVRNYNGSQPEENMPSIYARLIPGDARALESGRGDWRPQLIVINLGTNDYSTPLHAGEKWQDQPALHADYRAKYIAFVRRLQKLQPQAQFLLMSADAFDADVQAVAAALNAATPGKVATLHFGNLEFTGCDWHLTLNDDRTVANQLESRIAALGVWARRSAH